MFVVTSEMVTVVAFVTVTTHAPFHAEGVNPVRPIVLPVARPCAEVNTIVPDAPVPDATTGKEVAESHTPDTPVVAESAASTLMVGKVAIANGSPP
jgi:hypothetical protein